MAQTSSAATVPYSTGHLPALDGLRAIAFLLVVVFHSVELWENVEFVGRFKYILLFGRALWFGVDLFFVLSGFLITRILLQARASPHYFKQFYLRRSFRIFPLYYLFLAALIVGLYLSTQDLNQIRRGDRLSYWFYLQNFWLARSGWDDYRAINHLWSLAVEEQFYLVRPAVVWFAGARRLKHILFAMILGAVLLRVAMLLHGSPAIAVYVSTLTRVDCLAAGALVALMAHEAAGRAWLGRNSRQLLGLGLLLLAALFIWRRGYRIGDPAVQVIGYSVNALLFAAVIAGVVYGRTSALATGVLANPAMRWIGTRSYAGYLFHWPVAMAVQRALAPLGTSAPQGVLLTLALTLIVTMLAAEASWRLFEGHWASLRNSLENRLGWHSRHAVGT
jgi:peptidoglycan/LPS O-acetylase OafA/YrhL